MHDKTGDGKLIVGLLWVVGVIYALISQAAINSMVECSPYMAEVVGSSPSLPTIV